MSLLTDIRKFLGIENLTQLKRFLVTGTISTIVGYLVFLTATFVFLIHYLIANFIAFCIGIIFGYNLNKRWSFKDTQHRKSNFIKYLLVYLTSLLISTIILKITVDFMGIPPQIASLMSLCVTTCTNFLGIKFLVFKK